MPPHGVLGRAPRVPVGLRTGGGGSDGNGDGDGEGGCDAEAVRVTPLPSCGAGDAAVEQAETWSDDAEELDGGEESGEAWDERGDDFGSATLAIPDVPGAEEERQLSVAVLKDQRDDAVKMWVRMPPVRFLIPRRHRTQRMHRLRKEVKAKRGDVALLDRRLWLHYGDRKKQSDDRPQTYGGYLESGNRVLAFDSGRLCFDRTDHWVEGPQLHTMHFKRARKKG